MPKREDGKQKESKGKEKGKTKEKKRRQTKETVGRRGKMTNGFEDIREREEGNG